MPGARPTAHRQPGRGGEPVSGPAYVWRLRELMAQRGMFATSDLIEPLGQRGISMSRSQVYRLAAKTPERIHISLLLALCDIFDCQLTDIAVPVAQYGQWSSPGPDQPGPAGEG